MAYHDPGDVTHIDLARVGCTGGRVHGESRMGNRGCCKDMCAHSGSESEREMECVRVCGGLAHTHTQAGFEGRGQRAEGRGQQRERERSMPSGSLTQGGQEGKDSVPTHP